MSVLAVTTNARSWPVRKYVEATVAFDSSYPTGGETLNATTFGLVRFGRIIAQPTSGYVFQSTISADGTTALIQAFQGAAVTPAGTISAPTYTDGATSGALNLGTPLFSGTGLTAAGQVITTTSTHTMTLNQCAGMWLISATGATPPNLILSNTAVTSAAAVLTVQGAASTDAGAYKIVKVLAAGTISAPTFTGTATTAAALTEVPNATNLSALSAVVVHVLGD